MKLTVLTENHAGGRFLAEHGLSYLIEHDGKTILFDTGHSNVFRLNAEKLGVNLDQDVDTIVLSHGHWDHADGLKYIANKPLISHPSIYMDRFRTVDKTPVGIGIQQEYLEKNFNITLTKEPLNLSNQIFYLGEIPRISDFESQTTPFCDKNDNDDFVPDDSAIVIVQDNQLIIISGCAHSGICNICEHAKQVTGIKKIEAVIGGFHLKFNNLQTKETIKYFKEQGIKKLMPSHCTELPALAAFHSEFKIDQLKTGQQMEI